MNDSKRIIKEKEIKGLNLLMAGGKKMEREMDCLKTVKYYNWFCNKLLSQMLYLTYLFLNLRAREYICDRYVEVNYTTVYFCICLKLPVVKKFEKKITYSTKNDKNIWTEDIQPGST